MERQLLFIIRYRGTRYHGFQVQRAGVLTIAQVMQDAIEAVFKQRLDIKGCSRTDTGVHANRFALTLRTQSSIPCDAAVRALNIKLPPDVAVLECHQVPDTFHPRYDCTGKRYLYRIWNSTIPNPFLTDLTLQHPYPLDLARMNTAAKQFLGSHDFSAFCSAGSKVKDRVRCITDASVSADGALCTFSVTGSGFLYNMVRIMMGTLLEVSRGAIQPEQLPAILASKNRACAGPTAPARGLYLDEVFYPQELLAEKQP